MKPIDFWYSIGSTYTYLTVMRLSQYARNNSVDFNWRPFNVRSIMIEQKNIPFANKPVKSNYMWRDVERRAAKYKLPIAIPVPYPLDELALANQVALLGMKQGWGVTYTVEAYRLWFEKGERAGSEPNLSESIRRAGQDPEQVVYAANSREIVEALALQTEKCRDLGVFGAPSFVVDGEVFWGDDRLDDAVAWRTHGSF